MKYKILFLLIFLSILELNAIPRWYANPRQHRDHDQHLVGIGSGSTLELAKNVARADLIQQITVTVQTDTEVSFFDFESESYSVSRETINQNIRTYSQLQIAGIDIVNQQRTRRVWYVMVSLSRSQLSVNLTRDMHKLRDDINDCMLIAGRVLDIGNLTSALDLYKTGQRMMDELYAQRFIYENVFQKPFELPNLIRYKELANIIREIEEEVNRIATIKPEISITVVDTDSNHVPSVFAHISEVVSSRGYVISDNADRLLIANLSVKSSREMTFQNKTYFTVEINCDIEIVDTATKNVIGVYRTTEFGQTSVSASEAINLTLHKINIDNADFWDVLP
jgi:hypothetical protein